MSLAPAFDPAPLVPRNARILESKRVTAKERYFRLQLTEPLDHRPGQFVMLSLPGVGEAPISISCGPDCGLELELIIRACGSLTHALHQRQADDVVGLRGPFGNGFDLTEFEHRDTVIVAGGLGLVPLRSLIEPLVARPRQYGHITLISGCRTPADELYRDKLRAWAQLPHVDVIRLVNDADHQPWDHEVGLVTAPIPHLELEIPRTLAVLCGPPVMYKFVIMALAARGMENQQIFVDLERRMRCGVGKCGHCQINQVYACRSGPVFRFADLASLPEALS